MDGLTDGWMDGWMGILIPPSFLKVFPLHSQCPLSPFSKGQNLQI